MIVIEVSGLPEHSSVFAEQSSSIGTRQEVINRLRPYLLPVQVRALCSDQSFDVRDKAGKLLAILEVGMYTSGTGSATA
jgi:hypothetical protein